MFHAQTHEQFLKVTLGLSLGLASVHLFRLSVLRALLVSLRLCVVCFFVLDLVYSVLCQ